MAKSKKARKLAASDFSSLPMSVLAALRYYLDTFIHRGIFSFSRIGTTNTDIGKLICDDADDGY